MGSKPDEERPDPDERVALPLDPEEALRALLKVKPGEPTTQGKRDRKKRS